MYRYALCNELFGDMAFPESCALAEPHGFYGLELAPFTLGEDPRSIGEDEARRLRTTLEEHGLKCAGLHWLLAAPEGLHITTSDVATRRESWGVLEHLAWLCRALGGEVMILGSPNQRTDRGVGAEVVRERLVRGLRDLAPALERAKVRLLVEALSSQATNVVNTLAEARSVIDEVGSPWVRGMFDFHNVEDESEDRAALIRRHADYVEHVHINTLESPTRRRQRRTTRKPSWRSVESATAGRCPSRYSTSTTRRSWYCAAHAMPLRRSKRRIRG
jgi:sugar phosphate isomerase/epimerase